MTNLLKTLTAITRVGGGRLRFDPANDPISQFPFYTGPGGKAYILNIEATRPAGLLDGDDPRIAVWIVECPNAHPIWHSYMIFALSLHDPDRTKKFNIALPGATHEIVVAALRPDMPREDIFRSGESNIVEPINFIAQQVSDNHSVIAELDRAIQMICEGTLCPDTDARQQWVAIFGDSHIKRSVPPVDDPNAVLLSSLKEGDLLKLVNVGMECSPDGTIITVIMLPDGPYFKCENGWHPLWSFTHPGEEYLNGIERYTN